MPNWNPWHGCHKFSAGCRHCYVYRSDARYGRDSSVVHKTSSFDLPLRRDRNGDDKLPPGSMVYTCFTSDFFVPDADPWREEAWRMMKARPDLTFFFLTKRITRLDEVLPDDWGADYDHVHIGCTVENQEAADSRMPVYRDAPIRHKSLACEPLIGPLDLSPWLGPWVELLVAGGESGQQARICDYTWVLDLRRQCVEAGVPFHFKQTGARLLKDGRIYHIPRKLQHHQAGLAGLDHLYIPGPDRL